jgi:hypothetical protein
VSVVTDNVEALVAGLGVKFALAAVGNPPMLSVTAPLKPFAGVNETLKLVDEPCITLWLAGEVLNAKSGATTTRITVVVCVSAPLVPVMVRV